jgi:hypothetical protein
MAPGMKIAAGIAVGLVTIAGIAMALSCGIFASKQRKGTAETALPTRNRTQ